MNHASKKELTLSLVGMAAAGISPNVVVAASAGFSSMSVLLWTVVLPSYAVFFSIFFYARARGMDRLFQRLWIGLIGGIALTIILDIFRYGGVVLNYMPADMPLKFGKQILGNPSMQEAPISAYLLGYGYHFLNGIGFATVFSVLIGKSRWWAAVLYSVFFVELGMMTLPPMAKMLGPFGIEKYGTILNSMFLTTLVAHFFMGVALGLIEQKWGKYKGIIFQEGRESNKKIKAS
jgi:membrane-bound metal-dependent hydrolase YbcI (DUF457 family)